MKNAPERLTGIHLVPVLVVILRTVLFDRDARVVDQDVQAPCVAITSATVRRQSSPKPTLPWWIACVHAVVAQLVSSSLARPTSRE